MPGVEHAGGGLQADVLALSLCYNSWPYVHNVLLPSLAGNLRAASASPWTTEAGRAGGLVNGGGEEDTSGFDVQVSFRCPCEGLTLPRARTQVLAQEGAGHGLHHVHDVGEPGRVLRQAGPADTAHGE